MTTRTKLAIALGVLGFAGVLAWTSRSREANAQTTTGPTYTLFQYGGGASDGDKGLISNAPHIASGSGTGEIRFQTVKDGLNHNCTIKFQDQAAALGFVAVVRSFPKGAKIGCGGTFAPSGTALKVLNLATNNWTIVPN